MMSSAALKFDSVKLSKYVNLNLAQEYLKKNNYEFRCTGAIQIKGILMFDAVNNKIYGTDFTPNFVRRKTRNLEHMVLVLKLSRVIENNIELFCQLEYLIRKKPIQTTQIELNMIIKHLRYQALVDRSRFYFQDPLIMKNDSPLIDLGCLAMTAPEFHIIAAENTAVICHLFTELCRSVGFDRIFLSFMKNEKVNFGVISKSKVLSGGCIGVVTAQSNMQSAVDVFLSVPKGGLWGIRRILVQESACQRFDMEIASRTRSTSQAGVDPRLKSLCTNLYVYDDKLFLREYVGSDAGWRDVILVESFRTVKELLTRVERYQPFCVSLWSHGLEESHEIAFGISAPMVWVNRYGTVGDPCQVSLAYYYQTSSRSYDYYTEMEKVRRMQKDWAKLTTAERCRNLIRALQNNNKFKFYVQCICSAENQSRNFVHVGNSETIIGVRKPRDVYSISINWKSQSGIVADVIYHLCNGSGFLITYITPDDFIEALKLWEEAEVPIRFRHSPSVLSCDSNAFDEFPLQDTVRIVHFSFGTIFTN